MICVDSSVVAKWFFVEELSDQARALRWAAEQAKEPLVAPALLIMEVNNVFLKKMRPPDRISFELAVASLDALMGSEIRLHDPSALHRNALIFASDFQLPAIYDAYYLALAADAQCQFWTADQRLIEALRGRLPFVRGVGDFPL